MRSRRAATAQRWKWGPVDWLGRRWSQAALVALLLACTAGAVSAACLFPLPSYVKSRPGPPPERTASVLLKIENVTCRGRANLLFWYLDRDDMDRIAGWFQVEAWPGPGAADVRVTYDPGRTDGLVPQTGPAETGRPRRDDEAG